MDNLTVKQKAFCDYYLMSGNATQSAIKAGYSEASAYSTAHSNLKKPDVIKYIQSKNKELDKKLIADMNEVQAFWAETMRNEEYQIDDRLRASDLIARSNGAYLERVEQSGQLNLKVEWLDED